ncbi:MAG: enoyl-CoA hydratase/isomerase family protein [Flavobacteriales bacterium]|nr:enoyl-CoA hydratase/isomerase family protein [Flavobacteriales bacterium]
MGNINSKIVDGILRISLNRPRVFNSFNTALAKELQGELDRAENDELIRAVLLTGEGDAFSAGQDISELLDPNGPEFSSILSDNYNPIVRKIRNLNKPIVAVVNGVAAGAGANIALACDIVIASKSAKFIQIFSKIGLIPDAGGTYMLPRLIGWQKASALMMLADPISAIEAERLGMIYKVYNDDELENEAEKLVAKLSMMPTLALSRIKEALNKSFTNDFEQQLLVEEDLQVASSKTIDFKEGISAFVEKRKASFVGK